jgi:hypothetical protein
MSTTWTTLEVNTEIMRQLYSDVFNVSNYSATKIQDLKQAIAKDKMKYDCYRIFRIDPADADDLTDFDEIVDKYSSNFQRALMYLQCYYYFVENDDVDGKNSVRKNECLNNYKSELAGFADFYTDNKVTSTVGQCLRG